MSSLEAVNQSLFLLLNGDQASARWLVSLAAAAAEYLIFLIPLVLVWQWCWGKSAQREVLLQACLVAFVALGINQLLGMAWPHPRPFAMGLGHTFIAHAADSSFPSDHATVFAAIGLTLLFADPRGWAGWAVLLSGVVVAWARIFLGVHFPLDMSGAVGVVVATWLCIYPLWLKLGPNVTTHGEGLYRRLLSAPIARGWVRN